MSGIFTFRVASTWLSTASSVSAPWTNGEEGCCVILTYTTDGLPIATRAAGKLFMVTEKSSAARFLTKAPPTATSSIPMVIK